jgi:Ran GTPase-activating protein (RanGAP) involved in mRNA processing and transport
MWWFHWALGYSAKLVHVNLAGNRIGEKACKLLASAIRGHVSLLTVLNVSSNDIDVAGMDWLALALFEKSSFRVLNLSYNWLDDRAMAMLSRCFSSGHCAVSNLDVSSNMIGSRGGVRLATILRQCDTLKVLTVRCSDMAAEGLAEFAASLKVTRSLQELHLPDLWSSKYNLQLFAERLKQNTTMIQMSGHICYHRKHLSM